MPNEAILASIVFTFIIMVWTAVIAVRSEEQIADLQRQQATMKSEIEKLEQLLLKTREGAADDRKKLDQIAELEKRDTEELRAKLMEILRKRNAGETMSEELQRIAIEGKGPL